MLEIINFLPNCTKDRIQEFEAKHNLKLPEDYIQFLLVHNGGQPTPDGFQMIYPKKPKINAGFVQIFFGLDASDHPFDMDLEENMEAYIDRIPKDLLPIGSDPGGNAICLGIAGKRYGQIYFWDHSEEVEQDEASEDENLIYHNVAFISSSFADFIDGLSGVL